MPLVLAACLGSRHAKSRVAGAPEVASDASAVRYSFFEDNRMERPSSLGFGLGLRPQYYREILEGKPRVDWFEVISENFMVPGGQPLVRVAAPGRMFEKELARGASEGWQQLDQIARGAFGCVPPGRQQIEGERHRREQAGSSSSRLGDLSHYAARRGSRTKFI
jgi:hypothetical protein